MTVRVKCHIWQATNGEWTFHVVRGARIVLTPNETYKTRYWCRRAMKALALISTANTDGWESPLKAACLFELVQEQARWEKR